MDGREQALREKLERLMKETAETAVDLSRADGTIRGVPHYSTIEPHAHELGKQLSREVQQRQMTEVTAVQSLPAKCPGCGTRCDTSPKTRRLTSIDGEVRVQERASYCPACRRAFFPSA